MKNKYGSYVVKLSEIAKEYPFTELRDKVDITTSDIGKTIIKNISKQYYLCFDMEYLGGNNVHFYPSNMLLPFTYVSKNGYGFRFYDTGFTLEILIVVDENDTRVLLSNPINTL